MPTKRFMICQISLLMIHFAKLPSIPTIWSFHHFKYSHAFQYSLSYRTSSPSGMFVPLNLPLQPTPNLPNCTSVTKLSCPKQSFPLLEPTGSDYRARQSQRVCEISFITELLGSSIFQFFMYLIFTSFQLYFRVLKDRY